jgi:MFS family permease
MGETILFCVVFLSQVLLISWFYARRIISRRRYVLQNFPPSTHPRLYPQPIEYYERRLRNFARLNLAIVVAGLLIILALILATLGGEWDGRIVTPWSTSGEWDAAIVTPFFLVQLFASVSIDLWTLKHQKAMQKAPPPRVRTTELRRRRLLDFVSPGMLVVAALTNVAFIAFVLYYRRFEFPWFTAAGNIVGVAVMLLVFAAVLGIALRGPRPDPYQAHQDRSNVIRLVVKQALAFCIAIPVLTTAQLIIKLFDPDLLEPVIASLYCQGGALALLWPLYSYRVDKVDFDVYRQDARESTPDASARISSP